MHTRPLRLLFRSVVWVFSAIQSCLKPIQYLRLDPPHSVGAKHHPFWELAGLLQSRDVLRRVQNELLHLPLRKYPHHDVSMTREHRDALGFDYT